MKSKNLVVILIVLQIAMISSSFTILGSIDNQAKYLPDHINIAGKNLYYTALIIHQMDEFVSGTATKSEVNKSFDEFHANILLLKNGGDFAGQKINAVPVQCQDTVSTLEELFFKLESLKTDLESKEKSSAIELFDARHEGIESDLFNMSEQLVYEINERYNQIHTEKENLKLILPIINGIVYVATIIAIFKLIRHESKQIQKLEKLYTIGQMASRLAHDLRNPLTVIKANLDMLQGKKLDEESAQDRYKKMQCSVLDMSYIIEDVLEFARAKELTLSKQSVLKIIKSALSSINLPEKVEIKLPEKDIEINCDERKLQAVFVNIIVNAFDAVDGKGTVTIKLEKDSQKAKISISDSGPGIPKEIMPHIFEPLFTSKANGTGLGLGIAKNIIAQHKGTITVNNNPTTFMITLPIQ